MKAPIIIELSIWDNMREDVGSSEKHCNVGTMPTLSLCILDGAERRRSKKWGCQGVLQIFRLSLSPSHPNMYSSHS